LPGNTSAEEVTQWLSASGFTRVHAEREVATPAGPHKLLDVVADRFRVQTAEKARVIEAIELALKRGGRLNVYVQAAEEAAVEQMWRFSTGLHCPDSDLRYADPTPSLFSFNSAMGACDTCRGFGRVIGVDYGLVIPNDKLTLRSGAIKTLQTPAWAENQDDLMRHAEAAGIPRDTPWYKLTPEQQHWVIHGTPAYKNGQWKKQWYGIKRFFAYLETKAYKMHIRVLLSKYRSYTPCETCGGARLKLEALLWRLGSKEAADAALPPGKRFMPVGVDWTRAQLEAMPGLSLHDLMQLPIDRLREFFNGLAPAALQEGNAPDAEFKALKSLFEEIHTRLKYLSDVGIGYLTLDRQSRTL
ncbi:MAG: excinuclease ABC subunit A, partial [Polaromonas sp.]|nr:excinuclease ABC subunit A [Polaromonas sp.]